MFGPPSQASNKAPSSNLLAVNMVLVERGYHKVLGRHGDLPSMCRVLSPHRLEASVGVCQAGVVQAQDSSSPGSGTTLRRHWQDPPLLWQVLDTIHSVYINDLEIDG
jgi:hypothetical protein